MKSFFPPIRSTSLLSIFLKGMSWSFPNNKNEIYLTFDDGPTPEVTPWVLDLLDQKNIKATFFCIGKNVESNPTIYKRILESGHSIGNHSYNHLNGWSTDNSVYYSDIAECCKYVQSNLYRPPYGKISPVQLYKINKYFKVIMWDVLSEDYNVSLTPENVIHNVINEVRSGSIIVMHDSLKAKNNLKSSLEKIIDYCKQKGFVFKPISYNNEINASFN